MVSSPKMMPWLMAILCLAIARCSNVTDQHTSESQHDQVAILKQIRKLNEDGSYTYGYEAGDGSFKEHISMVQSRINRTATTKKPTILYTSSTESTSPKTSVVQPIPRTRKPPMISTTPTSSEPSTENSPRLGFIRPKGRHRFIINGQQRPVILEEDDTAEEDSQNTRTSMRDKETTLRKVVFTKRPLDQNLPPITEEFEDKAEEIKITSGNALRRQLKEEITKATPVVEHEDDHADIYGGALSTSRPLFTTTTPPRVIQRVNDIRQERQKHIYINSDNGPAKFEPSSRVYQQQETKTDAQEDRNPAQQVLIRTTTRAPADQREYIRQPVEPIYVRQQADAYLRDLSPGSILVPNPENNLEEDPRIRSVPLSRLLLRQEFGRLLPPQQPLYSGGGDPNVHYLTDSPPGAQEQEEAAPRAPINPAYLARQRAAYQRQLAYSPEGIPDPRRPILRPIPLPPVPQDEREYQNVGADYPYRGPLALPPEPPNPIAPPLSRRDFQLLLRRLLVSQYGIQALNYPRTYLEDALYDQQPYPTYQPSYQMAIPRELPYPAEPVAPIAPMTQVPPAGAAAQPQPYPERIPLRRSMYSRAINPLYQPEEYADTRYTKRVYRQKFYTNEVPDDGEEILPPHIREALLLRMLQLAINAERPIAMPNSMIMTTAAPSATRYRKSGPVRSVQILGEDVEEEKEMRKKM
ncbi:uncharacterized protein LOC106639578 [Copidosoma floridanum]|uniref:uncharacterized protein LOC106639578 n=1 Tax=Copidosoma floridanum TaxID=29053 RepID=UPI000C6F9CEB|nr:uncharacterized protein LOC106639578 [Copidosoma floridanum]